MIAMASSAFGFATTVNRFPDVFGTADAIATLTWQQKFWHVLAYEFSHVEWTGCSFWDLIQPSFMFMVGVSMPFSYSRRVTEGQSATRRFGHVLLRSIVLVLLGVFLSSNSARQTNFTFVNVLSQIGLGYTFLYLLLNRGFVVQLLAILGIVGGYWYYFYSYTIPDHELETLTTYIGEESSEKIREKGADEWSQFEGIAAHWNKHTNAAAASDRIFLNKFPRAEEPWKGQRFWINSGGYATLNFIPSLATMILGLMAGHLLRSQRSSNDKLKKLIVAGAICFVAAMAVDTSIWPQWLKDMTGATWSLCPIVKKIWTPSWAVFSSGWTFWILAAFYWVIDICGWRRWSFPLAVVGMNSIAMYCMSQMIKPWAGRTLKTHLTTVDQLVGQERGLTYYLFDTSYAYSLPWEYTARVFVLWLICYWMYRQKIFVRI